MHASRGLNSQTAAPILSGAELKVVPAITRVLVNLEIGGKNMFPLADTWSTKLQHCFSLGLEE